eukprot:Hpha_TRINITY_DN31004_c0_g1::TRINITY_DN31004_c0_g1_i1::g.64075::m.64075
MLARKPKEAGRTEAAAPNTTTLAQLLGVIPGKVQNLHTVHKGDRGSRALGDKGDGLHRGKTLEERLHLQPKKKQISHLRATHVSFHKGMKRPLHEAGWD